VQRLRPFPESQAQQLGASLGRWIVLVVLRVDLVDPETQEAFVRGRGLQQPVDAKTRERRVQEAQVVCLQLFLVLGRCQLDGRADLAQRRYPRGLVDLVLPEIMVREMRQLVADNERQPRIDERLLGILVHEIERAL
jgi:hypothetical protein